MFAAALYSQEIEKGRLDWRRATLSIRHEKYKLPIAIERQLLKLIDNFDLKYAAIDMIVTPDGEYVFLEVNPNGQFGWIEDKVGFPLYGALADLLISGKTN